MLTITVGLVLPGMIAHSAVEVANAADRLATGTLADFSRAMGALAAGDLDAASASVDFVPVVVTSRDEVGDDGAKLQHAPAGNRARGGRAVRARAKACARRATS